MEEADLIIKTENMRTKIFWKIFGWALLISVIISPLRGGYVSVGRITGMELSSIVGFIIYFALTVYFLIQAKQKLSSALILIAVIAGLSAITLPIHIIDFQSTLVSFLEYLIHLSAVLCGYLFYKSNLYFKIVTGFLSLIFCFLISTKGYDMWLHKLNFGTFTGKIEMLTPPDFQFTDEQGAIHSIKDFSGKYLVADFWFTGCGICFSKFSLVQTLYDKYKDNPDIVIFSMNTKIDRDTERQAFETIQELGYSFPVYRFNMEDSILIQLGVNVYPTVLIFNKQGNVIFRGDIENVAKYLPKLLNQ
jgi:thiol-disulfide isomerase/thioredoxin